MSCLLNRARTRKGKWYSFSINDGPVPISRSEFILMNHKNSPILERDLILCGDNKTKLFQGDIVLFEGIKYLIDYDRGFYAIDENYNIKFLSEIEGAKVVGDYWKDGFPLKLRNPMKVRYKYNDIIFLLGDVKGCIEGKLLLTNGEPMLVNPKDIMQDCNASASDIGRLYFGQRIENYVVKLHDGLIVKADSNEAIIIGKGRCV